MTTICSLAVIAASLLVVQFISISTAQVCDQPVDPGLCKMHIKRYYYDQETKICTEFIYGGCPGNGNNFLTKEECERTCKSVCDQPVDPGLCKMHIKRYYYDQETKICTEFIYGGCPGNGNNFLTKEECERTCKSASCGLPLDPGPCEVYMPRYYFERETQTCKVFIYGGCQGNGNNFKTKEECECTCK